MFIDTLDTTSQSMCIFYQIDKIWVWQDIYINWHIISKIRLINKLHNQILFSDFVTSKTKTIAHAILSKKKNGSLLKLFK